MRTNLRLPLKKEMKLLIILVVMVETLIMEILPLLKVNHQNKPATTQGEVMKDQEISLSHNNRMSLKVNHPLQIFPEELYGVEIIPLSLSLVIQRLVLLQEEEQINMNAIIQRSYLKRNRRKLKRLLLILIG